MIREIAVSVGRTVNLGNFESLRIDVSATATVGDGDDPESLRSQLSDWLKVQCRRTLAEQQRKEP